jgi:hypothetical protein
VPWPARAHTMIGATRLRHLRHLVERTIREGIAGDYIETGVWRGGACILMKGVLTAYDVSDRRVTVPTLSLGCLDLIPSILRINGTVFMLFANSRCCSMMAGDSARLDGAEKRMVKATKRRAWTKEDVRTLKSLAREKTKTTLIARKLKRTLGATYQMAATLGVTLGAPRKKREA